MLDIHANFLFLAARSETLCTTAVRTVHPQHLQALPDKVRLRAPMAKQSQNPG